MDTIHSAAAAIGLIEALNTKSGSKGVKGVVKDTDGKVNPTLTPAEKTRYQNIFKIAKSIMDPEPESGSIDPTVQPTQTPEIQKVPMVEQVATEKKDEGILGMLTGLLPLLPAIIPLLGAAVTGLALLFKDEITKLIKGWWGENITKPVADFFGFTKTPEEMLEESLKNLGINENINNLTKTINTLNDELTEAALEGKYAKRIKELNEIINGQGSSETQIQDAYLEKRVLELKTATDKGREEIKQKELDAIREYYKVLGEAQAEQLRAAKKPFGGGAYSSSVPYTSEPDINLSPQQKKNAEILQIKIDDFVETRLIRDYFNDSVEGYRSAQRYDPTYVEKLRKAIKKEYKISDIKIDDGIIFQNGRSTRIDSSDSIIAAKPGGPIEKMLDQNSAIQTEQLGVLKEIRDGIKELLKRDVPVLSNNGTALTFVPNKLLTEFFA